MANPEHASILHLGAAQWNAWRQSSAEVPDLSNLDLSGHTLHGYNFRRANFSHTTFDGASVRSSTFTEATLTSASMNQIDAGQSVFDGADCVGATFRSAKLVTTYFRGSNLRDTDFNGASMVRAECAGADCSNAVFSGGYLNEAFFDKTILNGARFEATDVSGANFTDAIGLCLDRTLVRNAIFSPYAKDDWSVLRRNYTGPRFIFHLLLLTLFFVPMLVKSFVWIGVNQGQQHLLRIESELQAVADTLGDKDSNVSQATGHALRRLARTTPCLAENCKHFPMWQVLLGFDQGWVSASLTVALLIYNLARGLLTWLVAPLRDEEERSGYSPALIGLTGYAWLVWPHQLVRILLFVAVGSFLWHGYHWLTVPVYLP